MAVGHENTVYDALIIGGGPAGLSTAGHLVRGAFKVIIFDSGQYRNVHSPKFHGIPGWDSQSPAKIREQMQGDILNRYGEYVSIVRKEITTIENKSDGARSLFIVKDRDGSEWWRGRKVVLATGVSDVLPSDTIPGYENCWVRGIFQCLTSQGLEQKYTAGSATPSTAGVLAAGVCAAPQLCIRLAAQAGQLVPHVRIYTMGDTTLADQLAGMVKPAEKDRITIENRKIARLVCNKRGDDSAGQHSSLVTVVFEDGEETEEAFLVHKPTMQVNGTLAKQLGLKMLPHIGHDLIHAEPPFNQTSVPGVFAVGDCASPQKMYAQALAMGACAAAALGGQLQMEDK
ncbi:thioredoxin reductase [Diaporthe helianthi]|uniref:Thioredoxin reductase n=1 Tax=Diaporthe helianthi TaxID=158607 RepID=A0A2P5IAZ2_DIAHE|nr:thioredoxin reductase [Diaporthe helianthi]